MNTLSRKRTPLASAVLRVAAGALLSVGSTHLCAQQAVDTRLDLRVDSTAQTNRLPGINTGWQAGAQSGRLFDVNPQVGAGGYNYARPVSPLMSGNNFAAGLASRGLSLRSYSPISDPTAFRAPLGSGSLYDFRRDSVSVLSSPLGTDTLGSAYYDPATTTPTGGWLQSRYLPGVAPASSVQPMDLRVQSRLGSPDNTTATGLSTGTPAYPAGPLTLPPPWATSSSIFGVTNPPRLQQPLDRTAPWERRDTSTDSQLANGTKAAADRRMPGVDQLLAAPLSQVLRDELYPRAGERTADRQQTRLPFNVPTPNTETPAPLAQQPDQTLQLGYDVFTDLQFAADVLTHPDAAWVRDLENKIQNQESEKQPAGETRSPTPQEYAQQMLSAPLRSLTGKGASPTNDQLLRAESLMDIRHYSEAADRYEAASLLDPTNPLPVIGKGHALLAQGQYRSAAMALLSGIELTDRKPGLAEMIFRRLDLRSLMGNGEIIDKRRADILRQLEQNESAELRFLLGYLEYHTGDRERGLEDLKKAALNPRSGQAIGRYPRLLEGESALKAPATPSATPIAPEPPPRPEGLVVPPRE
jgi:tetratricopeptide (TPR) repeat protein